MFHSRSTPVVYRTSARLCSSEVLIIHRCPQVCTMELFCVFLLFLNFLNVNGVYGDEVKSVSVMEGDSAPLHTGLTEKQKDDLVVWFYGPENTVVARINGKASKTWISDAEKFTDRLKLDNRTGSLTITNITTQDSELYQLRISNNNKVSHKIFNITVYNRLPVPVISREKSERSSECVVLCSVCNVSDVSLSWYKGMSLLSSISVSDLNIRLSLPLEVEYQDTDTYTCVINNPITSKTQHLHITQLCQMGSGYPAQRVIIISAVCVSVLSLIIIIIIINIIKHKRTALALKSSDGVICEEKSINSSSTSEVSTFLNKKQHW